MKELVLRLVERRIEEVYNVTAFKRNGKFDKETGLFNFQISTITNDSTDFTIYNGFVSSTGSIFITYINGVYLGRDNYEKI